MTIGIPRALFYYKYGLLWASFFRSLGIETLLSPPTGRDVLEEGLRTCVGEACLPVKAYFGHVQALRGRCDRVFIPRYISVHRHEFICPKFAGLPDMVRHSLPECPPVLETPVNHHRGNPGASLLAARDIGRQLGFSPDRSRRAFMQALGAYRAYRAGQVGQPLEDPGAAGGGEGRPRILLLGHAYNVLDEGVNLRLAHHLQSMGARVYPAQSVDGRTLRALCGRQEEPLFWTLGVEMLGAAYDALRRRNAEGVITLSSFGCGLDAFVENMVARRMHRQGMPYMALTMDEHTAQAGMLTRLEAFMDTLNWRRNHGADLPPYGQCDPAGQGLAGRTEA